MSSKYRNWGPAEEAPNPVQRWFLVESPLLVFAGVVAAVIDVVGAFVVIAKGGTLDGPVALLAVVGWVITTLLVSFVLILIGWPSNRKKRMVRYLGRGVPVSDPDRETTPR